MDALVKEYATPFLRAFQQNFGLHLNHQVCLSLILFDNFATLFMHRTKLYLVKGKCLKTTKADLAPQRQLLRVQPLDSNVRIVQRSTINDSDTIV